MSGGPQDPVQGIGQVAVILHEFFTSLVRAEFSEAQALYLAGKYVEGIARTGGAS